jgi:hypothetical protein
MTSVDRPTAKSRVPSATDAIGRKGRSQWRAKPPEMISPGASWIAKTGYTPLNISPSDREQYVAAMRHLRDFTSARKVRADNSHLCQSARRARSRASALRASTSQMILSIATQHAWFEQKSLDAATRRGFSRIAKAGYFRQPNDLKLGNCRPTFRKSFISSIQCLGRRLIYLQRTNSCRQPTRCNGLSMVRTSSRTEQAAPLRVNRVGSTTRR